MSSETITKNDLVAILNEVPFAINVSDTYDPTSELAMSGKAVAEAITPANNAPAHNAIYRGKFLGNAVTADQWNEIAQGTFNDLYIGDYWTINNIHWRIADFDYWINYGQPACTTHHIVIIPDETLYEAKMNNSNTTSGGYINSKMRTDNLATAKTTINNAFGSSHVLNKLLQLSSAVTNGYVTSTQMVESTVDLMNEINVYGTKIYSNICNGTSWPDEVTYDHSQFALFRYDHSRICTKDVNGETTSWWIRDIGSPTDFILQSRYGNILLFGAGESKGVRPCFGIC